MFDHKAALVASIRYLKEHPEQFLHAARRARHWTFSIPIAALNWLAKESAPTSGPSDLRITQSSPGLRVEATVEQMNTLLRISSVVIVERVALYPNAITVGLRLKDVEVRLLDDAAQTPLAALIRSQTLDLSRVASLVAYLPSRPAALIEALDDRLVIDLMKVPQLASDARLKAVLTILSAVFTVERVHSVGDQLELCFRPLPRGFVGLFRTRLLGRAG